MRMLVLLTLVLGCISALAEDVNSNFCAEATTNKPDAGAHVQLDSFKTMKDSVRIRFRVADDVANRTVRVDRLSKALYRSCWRLIP